MKIQVQEYGSDRSQDVVEALEWMLLQVPDAEHSRDSIIVLLDWFSGHLTDEVADLVKRKGHVLLFHGGGCTPFTQINDTHLHASLASLLSQIENEWKLTERARLLDLGLNKTPQMSQEDIISIVQQAWLTIPHGDYAEKGYGQTGPAMPMQGAISQEQVFKDLLRVWKIIDPSTSPTQVGTTMRDEAIKFVKKRTCRWQVEGVG